MLRFLLGVALLGAPVACRSQAERELGREVTAMAHLVNQVREVKNARERGPALAALRGATCQAAEVCQLQQTCVQPYQVEAHALAVTEQVAAALAVPESDKAAAAQLIATSERELKDAHNMMHECLKLQTSLEERYVAKR